MGSESQGQSFIRLLNMKYVQILRSKFNFSPTTLIKYLVVFIIISICYLSFNEFWKNSFIWQMTTLGNTIRPVSSKHCNFLQSNHLRTEIEQKKIGLIMIYGRYQKTTSKENFWTEDIMKPIIENRMKYCQRHNYTLINAKDIVDTSRPISWSKLLAVQKYIDDFDYLFYVDMDIVIMRMDFKLEWIINHDQGKHDFIVTKDWYGVNFGVWLARKSEWTKWFVSTAWNQTQLIPKYSINGKPHPFDYEQRAIHYLLNTNTWQKSKLPQYPGNSTDIRLHFSALPQCVFNSYVIHPFDFRGSRDSAHYSEGDFIIHFAGKRGKKKIDLMKYYLAKVNYH